MTQPLFDQYAKDYNEAIHRGLRFSGESKEYFAYQRILWTRRKLQQLGIGLPKTVMDYGCGTGGSLSFLKEQFQPASLLGLDVSASSLEVANKEEDQASLHLCHEYKASGNVDLVYCNGVFHHLTLNERPQVLAQIHASLKDDGLFALWENNPWNPGTRWVMSKIPFDKDALLINPSQASRLLRGAGFEPLGTTSQFFFPRLLSLLRPLESALSRIPLGGQYLILARKCKKEQPSSSV